MSSSSVNNRAALLANLRTGGVRSSTNPQVPMTAAPTVSTFQLPEHPMTASVSGSFNIPNHHIHPHQVQAQAQVQALQMQMMQMEIMRLQAIQQAQQVQQAQQLQAALARQQNNNAPRRASSLGLEPATAGPTTTSFPRSNNVRPSAELLKAQLHLNAKQNAQQGVYDQVPMTAAIGGRFGGRLNPNATSFRANGLNPTIDEEPASQTGFGRFNGTTPANSSYTTVISGGTALGNGAPGATPTTHSGVTPSKSDSSMNWRRGGNNNSVLSGNRATSLNVTISPPPADRSSPPLSASPPNASNTVITAPPKVRPQPLKFSVSTSPPVPIVAIDGTEIDTTDENENETDDAASSGSSVKSGSSSPTTPVTSGSNSSITPLVDEKGHAMPPLSPREEATKRLYEGLGIGRPAPQTAAAHVQSFPDSTPNSQIASGIPTIVLPQTSIGAVFPARMSSQPVLLRQPRGPPSGVEELGPKNFASRIRRKAIGGLEALLDARVRGREVEVC